jgi:hypothetical protein
MRGSMGWSSTAAPEVIEVIKLRNDLYWKLRDLSQPLHTDIDSDDFMEHTLDAVDELIAELQRLPVITNNE